MDLADIEELETLARKLEERLTRPESQVVLAQRFEAVTKHIEDLKLRAERQKVADNGAAEYASKRDAAKKAAEDLLEAEKPARDG